MGGEQRQFKGVWCKMWKHTFFVLGDLGDTQDRLEWDLQPSPTYEQTLQNIHFLLIFCLLLYLMYVNVNLIILHILCLLNRLKMRIKTNKQLLWLLLQNMYQILINKIHPSLFNFNNKQPLSVHTQIIDNGTDKKPLSTYKYKRNTVF